MIRYRNNTYNEAYVEGDDIQLEGLTETIIFPDLAKRIRIEAEADYWKEKERGRMSEYVEWYFDQTIENYLEAEKESAQIVKHCVN